MTPPPWCGPSSCPRTQCGGVPGTVSTEARFFGPDLVQKESHTVPFYSPTVVSRLLYVCAHVRVRPWPSYTRSYTGTNSRVVVRLVSGSAP